MNNKETKLHTITLMNQAISELTIRNDKVTQKNVAEHCKLSIRTVMRYWKMIAQEIKMTAPEDVTVEKMTAPAKKVTPESSKMTAPIRSSFNRLKQRRMIGEQAPKSIIETIPSLQKLLNKV